MSLSKRLVIAYQEKCKVEGWSQDNDQSAALESLGDAFENRPKTALCLTFWKTPKTHHQGLYMFGDVGRGKTLVMDLFFDVLGKGVSKKRVHFNEFMLDIHGRLHDLRASNQNIDTEQRLLTIAADYAKGLDVLCFDEFFVEDVADAMLLERLFAGFLKQKVFVVMTSNIAPKDLYKDGLQYDRFLPFIQMVEKQTTVFEFDGAQDYRAQSVADHDRYVFPLNDAHEKHIQAIFKGLTAGKDVSARLIKYKGRDLVFDTATQAVVMSDFETLCDAALGAGDYLEISTYFESFIIKDIPQLDDENRNAVRRFIALIDVLYDHRKTLFCSAAVDIDGLYQDRQYALEFKRTQSRLHEMLSISF